MNWGHGIVITLVVFAIIILQFVYRAFQSDVNLVAADYYRQELVYEEHIEKLKNTERMKTNMSVKFNQESHTLGFDFPTPVEKGSIHFYRPSDSKIDVKMRLEPFSGGSKEIDLSDLKRGIWTVKVEWQDSLRKMYFFEHHLYIQ